MASRSTPDLDGTDREILRILQDDARTSNAEIARRVGIAPSAIFNRVRKLEEAGLLRGYEARLDAEALDFGLLAFVFVTSTETAGAVSSAEALAAIPEVQEVHHVAGEDCFLIKVRAASNAAFARLLRERINAIPSVSGTRTTIVLETVKETARLPLAPADPSAD